MTQCRINSNIWRKTPKSKKWECRFQEKSHSLYDKIIYITGNVLWLKHKAPFPRFLSLLFIFFKTFSLLLKFYFHLRPPFSKVFKTIMSYRIQRLSSTYSHQVGINLLKVNDGNTRTMCEIFSKLSIKRYQNEKDVGLMFLLLLLALLAANK